MRLTLPFLVAGFAIAVSPAAAQDRDHRIILRNMVRTYQGRNNGPEQTERFSRKVKLGRDGRFTLGNVAGDIVITAGSGDEVSIEAVKRTRGPQSELASVHIDVDERAGRVDVQTTHTARNDRVSVDYTVSVPAPASVDVHSISGSVKVTGVHGALRASTVSGNVTANDTPKLESAKSVSGDVSLTGAGTDGDLSASTLNGNVTARGVKARGLDVGTVSGNIVLGDVTCDRLGVKSISGNVEFGGALARSGRYEITAHSGNVRILLANPSGFELNANSFSGSIRSDLPLTISTDSGRQNRDTSRRRGPVNSHNMRATFGDGSATLTIRTFSGDIVIAKR